MIRTRLFRRAATMLGAVVVVVGLGAQGVAAGPAGDLVEDFHRTLLGVMKSADELKLQGRYERLAPAIEQAFNLAFMVRIATGGAWRGASPAEKAALLEAFKRVSVATYATRFDGFSGERFEMLGEQDGPNRTRLVMTRIVRPDDEPVPITYVTRQFGERWQIIDVIVSNGISELAVRRSEYAGILDRGGPKELIAALNRKADQMMTP